MKTLLICLVSLMPLAAQAAGDAAKGKAIYEASKCSSACHDRIMGAAGKGNDLYTRKDRKVTSMEKLTSQVQMCNTMLKTNWFPEEEAHVAAYLNQQYYKFKK
jgi:hypothetical protein